MVKFSISVSVRLENKGKTDLQIKEKYLYDASSYYCLSMESIRLGDPAHGIVTKTVHKILPGGGGGPGGWWRSRQW